MRAALSSPLTRESRSQLRVLERRSIPTASSNRAQIHFSPTCRTADLRKLFSQYVYSRFIAIEIVAAKI
eukprot:1309171-Pleurochrysis_carterae.AAC.1